MAPLLISDEAIKVILIWQNDQLPPHEQFIISDLDSRHLLVKTSEIESIEQALNTEVSFFPQYHTPGRIRPGHSSLRLKGLSSPLAPDRTDSSDAG